MPIARNRPRRVTASDGRIHLVGGRNDNSFPVDAVDVYDPSTSSWSTATSVPRRRGDAAVALGGDGQIYVIGGCCDQNGYLDLVDAYDPSADA